jgi:hypothetical protein
MSDLTGIRESLLDQLSADIQPKTDKEWKERALFFTAALALSCSKILHEYIVHCEEVVDKGQQKPSHLMTTDEHNAAVKELLCVSILLTRLDHDLENKLPWLKDFYFECFLAADKLLTSPKSSLIIPQYDSMPSSEDAASMASMNLCHKLRTGTTSVDASIFLGTLLQRYSKERSSLLYSSFTEPIDQLDKRIGPQ